MNLPEQITEQLDRIAYPYGFSERYWR